MTACIYCDWIETVHGYNSWFYQNDANQKQITNFWAKKRKPRQIKTPPLEDIVEVECLVWNLNWKQ